jgi:hypothetical protein
MAICKGNQAFRSTSRAGRFAVRDDGMNYTGVLAMSLFDSCAFKGTVTVTGGSRAALAKTHISWVANVNASQRAGKGQNGHQMRSGAWRNLDERGLTPGTSPAA